MAAASPSAAHLVSQQTYAAINPPLQRTPACNNGKIAAGHTHSSRKPHDMRTHCTDRCPHCSCFCSTVVLRVLSMLRCIPTASSSAALTLAGAHHSPHSTHRRKARRAWPRLAWWLLDACILNAFQLWSIGQHRPSQLRFREELMHELLKQLPSESIPRKRGAGLHPAHALASEHFPERAGSERDCVECSRQPDVRVQSRFLCHACQVHLCIGSCFSRHHA